MTEQQDAGEDVAAVWPWPLFGVPEATVLQYCWDEGMTARNAVRVLALVEGLGPDVWANDNALDHVLWEETAFPFNGLRGWLVQAREALHPNEDAQ